MTVRLLLIICAPFLVSGCLPEQKRQSAQCSLEGTRIYPSTDHAGYNDRGRVVLLCMKAAGYEFSWAASECPADISFADNPYCFEPDGFIGRYILRAELAIRRIN